MFTKENFSQNSVLFNRVEKIFSRVFKVVRNYSLMNERRNQIFIESLFIFKILNITITLAANSHNVIYTIQ